MARRVAEAEQRQCRRADRQGGGGDREREPIPPQRANLGVDRLHVRQEYVRGAKTVGGAWLTFFMEEMIRGIADELLGTVATISRAEVRRVQLIADLVDASCTVSPTALTGGERLVRSGGDGTPEVAEFLVVELAAMLKIGAPSAWALIRDVLNLRHRHPRLWAALERGEVPVWQARKVAARCAETGLSREAATLVDHRLESSWSRLSWRRILRKTEGLIVAADTALAAQRAAERRAERFVAVHHDGDGSSTLLARMNTADAVCLSDAIGSIANAMVLEGRSESLPQLRSEALAELARPTARGTLPRPTATLVVHVPREAIGPGHAPDEAVGREGVAGEGVARQCVAREDEIGPLLLAQVRELLAHHRVRLLPVLDLAGDPGADSYEIPDRIRTQLQIREPFSIFPFSTTRSVHADLDHTVPYQAVSKERHRPPDQTRPSNLGPLGRLEHRAKTHGRWQLSQPGPGTYRWRSGLGYEYVVNNGYSDRVDGQGSSVPERETAFGSFPDFVSMPDWAIPDAPLPDVDEIEPMELSDSEVAELVSLTGQSWVPAA